MMSTINEIWATLQAYRQILGFIAIFFGPSILGRVVRFVRARRGGTSLPQRHSYPLSPYVLAIAAAQAAYTAYALYYPPYNVFTEHGLVVKVPQDKLVSVLLRDHGLRPSETIDQAHPMIALLISRLSSMEGRYLYTRWGHTVFMSGIWCRDREDFAIAAIPHILGPYVAEALLIGAMGWTIIGGPGASERALRYRGFAGWAIGAMVVFDFGARWSTDIRAGPDGDCLQLDALLRIARTVALLATTLAYAFMPLPQDERAAEASLVQALDSALNTQRLTALARAAVNRSPAMLRVANEKRERTQRAEDAARADPEVVKAAQAICIMEGNDHSPRAKANAQEWIVTQWRRLVNMA